MKSTIDRLHHWIIEAPARAQYESEPYVVLMYTCDIGDGQIFGP